MSEEKRAFKGIWIPKDVWLDTNLTWTEKILFVEIDSLDNEDGCFAGNEYFAKFFNLSKNRISKMVSSLKEKGYITVSFTYREGTKEIERRVIHIDNRYRRKQLEGIGESNYTPIGGNDKDNNTSINNTTNNTSNKEYSMDLKEKKKKEVKHKYGEFDNVLLTDVEYNKLQERFPHDLKSRIERLSGYVASTGKSYKSHYATVINWAKKDKPEDSRSVSVLDKIKQME